MEADVVTVVILVALLASLTQSVTAFGFALVSVPFLVLVLDVQDTVVTVSLLALYSELILAYRVRGHVEWGTVGTMMVGSWAGMPLGLVVLLTVPEEPLRLAVGVAVLLMAGALAAGARITARGRRAEFAVGATSGVLATSTSVSGPPVVAYLVGRGDERDAFRGVTAVYLVTASVAAVAIFAVAGAISRDALLLSLFGMPAVVAGQVVGARLIGHVDAALFRRLVIALLMATALSGVGFSLYRLVS